MSTLAQRDTKSTPARSRRWKNARPVLVVASLLVALALFPVGTLQGVNYVVSERTVPLYAKALDFVDRDVNYRRVASQVIPQNASDHFKVRAALDWTRSNIRDTPGGFPVLDDHIWHIVIRGYGQDDQKADVFTTLLTYAGLRSYWMSIGPGPELTMSFVEVGERWGMVDVQNNVIVVGRDGEPASVEEIAANPAIAARQGPAMHRGVPYNRFFDGFRAPLPPDVTRAEMQMPLARAWFEIRRTVGLDVRGWQMRGTRAPS